MRTATQETKDAVWNALNIHGGSRAFARTLDPSKYDQSSIRAAAYNAALDKSIALEKENELRSALGLEPLPRVVEKQVCPIHDTVHDCTCDGQQGQAVWVHPKEKLVKAPGFGAPRKERKTIQLSPDAHAIMLKWRERIGGDGWTETIMALDYLASCTSGHER